jgi:hypothetical protein
MPNATDIMTALKHLNDMAAEQDPLGPSHDLAASLLQEFQSYCRIHKLGPADEVELNPTLFADKGPSS